MNNIRLLFYVFTLSLLVGCGGGDSNDSGGGSAGSGGGSAGSGGGSAGSGGGSTGSGSGSTDSGGGQVKPSLAEYEQLPASFTAKLFRNGHTVEVKLNKYSTRREDTTFYYFDATKSSGLIPFDYIPEVRSYRGEIVGESSSQVIGYVDSTNHFYGFVFYGEDKAWIIKGLAVPNINTSAKKNNDSLMNRQPKELIPIENGYQLPTPSLASPIPNRALIKLQMSSVGYLVDIDSFRTSFKKNVIDTIAAMDHTTNALDYFFARDALVRIDYPIGVVTVNSGGKSASDMDRILRPLVRSSTASPFSIFHNFFKAGERCGASGLSSSCDFHPDLAHVLHEIGHTFELGHHVGPETNTLMNFALAIDTNMVSVVKSSRAIEPRLAPAMNSKMSPKANIDHVGTQRNQPVLIAVLDNDYDANGANKGGLVSLHSHDVFSQQGAKVERVGTQLKYSPVEGFVGEDHFSYTITDDTGMKDISEVHVSVKSDARVLYLSADKYKIRQDIKNHAQIARPDFMHLINQAGKEQFFGKLSSAAYPNIGFHQFVIDQTSTNTAGAQQEPTFEDNNRMTLQKHMPHDLVPGKQSFSLVAKFKQDGDYTTVAENRGIHEISIFSSGKLDEGFALSYFNGNRHRAGEPEKGLGWTLVSRQMFSRQNFNQTPHTVHAFAKPDAVMITDNQWHDIAWVIDREQNRVSTWVDGKIAPMALSSSPTNFMDYVPLPDGFEGVYPGGTHGWIDSSWDAATEVYGPWFMRTNGQNKGKNSNDIWVSITNFIATKLEVDDVQIYTHSLSAAEIKNQANKLEKAFTNHPVNGSSQSFSNAINLQWDSKHASRYRIHWGYDTSLSSDVSEQASQSFEVFPDTNKKALYWRVDSKHGNQWVKGNVWSVVNADLAGEALALTFTNHELVNKKLGEDNTKWPQNATQVIRGINVVVAGQTRNNDNSILRMSKNNTITLSDTNGRDFSHMRFSASQWTAGVEGLLKVEYFDGSEWVSVLTLDKGGVASGYGFNGELTSRAGIGSTKMRGSKPDWYDPAALDESAYYAVNFSSNTSLVRLKFDSSGSDRNQIAIDQLNLYR
ncbi:Ig-like domain-containing protein [Photobacterium sanguinicancri]|uniref:Ig-like domain-containing protein n=1 Tax=Photobacterium sanguinicancri TaxID=875932 RepID=UPI003D0F8851